MNAAPRLLLAAALLAGCGQPAAREDRAFARPDRRLESTSWRMLNLAGEPVLGAPGAAQQPTLTFQNGFASWTIGCNGFDALYRSEDDGLALRPRHARRIGGCQAWEQPVQAALWGDTEGKGMAFRRRDRDLVIQTPQGPLELRRVPFQPVRAR